MIKVKASMILDKLPTDILIDIPKEDCNRDKWMEHIKEVLFSIFSEKVKIKYTLVESQQPHD